MCIASSGIVRLAYRMNAYVYCSLSASSGWLTVLKRWLESFHRHSLLVVKLTSANPRIDDTSEGHTVQDASPGYLKKVVMR